MNCKEAEAILHKAGYHVRCPVEGETIGTAEAARGNHRIAAAAYLLGSACCLGHNRAARYMEAHERELKQ